jgi:hypothetical protein
VFGWPPGTDRGDDMLAEARAQAQAQQAQAQGGGKASDGAAVSGKAPKGAPWPSLLAAPASSERDDRPSSTLSIAVGDAEALRGTPVRLRGAVRADGEACGHVAVEFSLRDVKTQKQLALGTLATGDDGTFSGGLVLPASIPLGDYDVIAETAGDVRCGAGSTDAAR